MVGLTTDLFGTKFTGSQTDPSSFGGRVFGTPASMSTFQNLSPQQQAALNQLLSQLSTTSAQPTAYAGQLTAPTNQLQSTSLAALEQQALNAASPTSGAATSSKALTDIINAQPQDLTSYFQKTIVDPAMQTFNQQILPAITQRFQGLSGFGSDRILQEGIAAGNVGTGIASQMSTASQQALADQQKNKLAAAAALPGVDTTTINNLLNLQAGGTAAQATAQAPLTAAYSEFQRQQQAQQTNVQALLQALGVQTTTPVVMPGSSGLLAGGAGANAAGGLISKYL